MRLNALQAVIIALMVALGTVLTRALPFVLFPEGKKKPQIISYLAGTIPAAMMGLLVVYCLKGISLKSSPYGVPELIAIAVTAGLHIWRKNVLLSIVAGTLLYMLLVQLVFV
ncbi:MAG: branched-chain amino acid transporter permease [Oscillospiraceae bacterium]|nr:branched-chain amino acid transporter permease [Oscillospiraceae bacterium]